MIKSLSLFTYASSAVNVSPFIVVDVLSVRFYVIILQPFKSYIITNMFWANKKNKYLDFCQGHVGTAPAKEYT